MHIKWTNLLTCLNSLDIMAKNTGLQILTLRGGEFCHFKDSLFWSSQTHRRKLFGATLSLSFWALPGKRSWDFSSSEEKMNFKIYLCYIDC